MESITASAATKSFNPLPGSIPGETPAVDTRWLPKARFNPLPGSIPGETAHLVLSTSAGTQFQSAPGFYPRRNQVFPHHLLAQRSFNPLPGSIPGETWNGTVTLPTDLFQSAPGFYPRRNPGRGPEDSPVEVSIRSRVLSQEKQHQRIGGTGVHRVSIRSRVLSQEKPPARNPPAGAIGFQSAPGFYPRRNVSYTL